MTVICVIQTLIDVGTGSSVPFVAGIARTIKATVCIIAACIYMTVVSIDQALVDVNTRSSVAFVAGIARTTKAA